MSNFKHSVRVRFRVRFIVRVRVRVSFTFHHTLKVRFTRTQLKVNCDLENNIWCHLLNSNNDTYIRFIL